MTVVQVRTTKLAVCPDCEGTGIGGYYDVVDPATGKVLTIDLPEECERCWGRGTLEAIEVHVIV